MKEKHMLTAVLEDSVVRNVDMDGDSGTIFMGPNSILHGVRVAPNVVIVNAVLDEKRGKRHQRLLKRESDEEYEKFLADRKVHSVEAREHIEEIDGRFAAGETEIHETYPRKKS